MSQMELGQADSFDVLPAEAAVSAASSGHGNSALKTCLDQVRAASDSASRSSVTYNVWSEWVQVNVDR